MLGNRTKNPIDSREGRFGQLPELLFRGHLGRGLQRCTAQFDLFVHDLLGSVTMDVGNPATKYSRLEYVPSCTFSDRLFFSAARFLDRKSTRLNSSHLGIS